MAKREQMYRLMHIINFLRSKKTEGATYLQVKNYLQNKYYQDGFDGEMAFSEKTFKRDRTLLDELFGIETGFKRSTATYQILDESFSETSQTIFDNLLLINAYKQTVNHGEIMFFEKREATGINLSDGIVFAIKNSKVIRFDYIKHWEGISHPKVIEPYALKEFRNRWYLIANERDGKDFFLKTYGLDRISKLEISASTFKKQSVDIEAMFENSFGIISSLDEKPIKIIISIEPWQGMYVKSLPIHHSQKIIVDNKTELKIELNLVPTYDFYQEMLTHAERVLAIEPKQVRDKYINFLEKGIKNLKK